MIRVLSVASLVILALVLTVLSAVVSRQGETTVVLRFGKPVRVIEEPGLSWKLPTPIDRLRRIDTRLAIVEPRPSEFLTADKKNVVLSEAVCYRITDPLAFMRTVKDGIGLELRLSDLVTSFTGLLLGQYELDAMVNVDHETLAFDALVIELRDHLREACQEMGIEVEQVFIKQIMLPEQNKTAVYKRMRAERDRIAQRYVAEGEEEAARIRAEADLESRTLLAEASRRADIIRGEAEAEAMRIYGETYRGNLDFYRFVRSLEAYEKIFDEQSSIILDENSPLLEVLREGAGALHAQPETYREP